MTFSDVRRGLMVGLVIIAAVLLNAAMYLGVARGGFRVLRSALENFEASPATVGAGLMAAPLALLFLARLDWGLTLAPALFLATITVNVGPAHVTPGDVIGLLLAVAFVLWLAVGRQSVRFDPPYLLLLGYIGAACLSLVVSVDRSSSMVEIVKLVQYALIVFAAYALVVRDVKLLARVLMAVALSIAAIGVILLVVPLSSDTLWQLGWHKNYQGSLFVLGIPLVLGLLAVDRREWMAPALGLVLWASLFVMAAALVRASSRASLVGMAFGLVVFLLSTRWPGFWRRSVIFVPVLFLALSAAITTPIGEELGQLINPWAQNVYSRVEAADLAWTVIRERPALGIGIGAYQSYVNAVYPDRVYYMGNNVSEPHSFLLYVFAETGVVGLLAFLAVLFYLCSVIRSNLDVGDRQLLLLNAAIASALLGYLGRSLFDLFNVRGTGPVFWLLFGLLVAIYNLNRQGWRQAG